MLNSCRPTVVWIFAILRESLNVRLYYVTFVCGIMAISHRRPSPSSATFLVIRRHRPSSSATSNNLGHMPVDHLAGPSAILAHRHRCPEPTSEAQKPLSPAHRRSSSSLGSCYLLPDRGVCHYCSHMYRSRTWPAN